MDAGDPALAGAKVTSIGGHPIAEVLSKLDPYLSRDNDNVGRVLPPYLLAFPEALHELGLVPTADAVPLAGTKRDGSPFAVTIPVSDTPMHPHIPKLAAFTGAPAPAYLTRVDEPFWFEDLSDSVVWFQFNQVANGPKESLAQCALRLRRHLDGHGTRDLVIDVRHNNGGNGYLLNPMVRAIVHFETTRPGARTFVITGPYTFSACQTFIAQVDRLTNAVFVGEPSASKPTFVGEDTELLLPWSGTIGSISTRLHSSYPLEERTWIAPEIPVPSLGTDWLAGKDAARDAVLAVIAGAAN
jgi:hypothetical protein